jgi:hypothetical protein
MRLFKKCQRCQLIRLMDSDPPHLCDECLKADGLYRVVGRGFVAGFEVRDGVVVRAAPILKALRGRLLQAALDHCGEQGWEVEHRADDVEDVHA